jgi:hypothetical protein
VRREEEGRGGKRRKGGREEGRKKEEREDILSTPSSKISNIFTCVLIKCLVKPSNTNTLYGFRSCDGTTERRQPKTTVVLKMLEEGRMKREE